MGNGRPNGAVSLLQKCRLSLSPTGKSRTSRPQTTPSSRVARGSFESRGTGDVGFAHRYSRSRRSRSRKTRASWLSNFSTTCGSDMAVALCCVQILGRAQPAERRKVMAVQLRQLSGVQPNPRLERTGARSARFGRAVVGAGRSTAGRYAAPPRATGGEQSTECPTAH